VVNAYPTNSGIEGFTSMTVSIESTGAGSYEEFTDILVESFDKVGISIVVKNAVGNYYINGAEFHRIHIEMDLYGEIMESVILMNLKGGYCLYVQFFEEDNQHGYLEEMIGELQQC
jgi:hypothetical protein